MACGDHLFVDMGLYSHHGIDLGDGSVAHWWSGSADKLSLFAAKSTAVVQLTPLSEFAGGRVVQVREYAQGLVGETVRQRALSQLGREGYDLIGDNCEHFATWCRTGFHESEQVKDALALVQGLPTVGASIVGGVRLVSLAGPAGGLSIDGALAGLHSLGRYFGGNPAVAFVMLSAAPSLAALTTLEQVINDDPLSVHAERAARAAGRGAAAAGALLGIACVMIAAAAAGLPGLAALGGGSIALGLAIALAGPALLCLAAGGLVYQLARPRRYLQPPCPDALQRAVA
jgi:hypothetical protein